MEKKWKISLLLVATSMLTACITNPNISKDLASSQIGCSPKDIKITDETARMGGIHNWNAECKGQKFICSYNTTAGTKCIKPIK